MSSDTYIMPSFIGAKEVSQIEFLLLRGVTDFNYINCVGISAEAFYELATLFDNFRSRGAKIKEFGISKDLKNIIHGYNWNGGL